MSPDYEYIIYIAEPNSKYNLGKPPMILILIFIIKIMILSDLEKILIVGFIKKL